jgi:hypothetical protein
LNLVVLYVFDVIFILLYFLKLINRILKPDYLKASSNAGYFLTEKEYEWEFDDLSENSDKCLISASKRWRQLLEKNPIESRGI